MKLFNRIDSFDDVIEPRRGLFVAPDEWHLVLHMTLPWRQLFLADYGSQLVNARPWLWVRVARWKGGRVTVSRGAGFNPSTVYGAFKCRHRCHPADSHEAVLTASDVAAHAIRPATKPPEEQR